MKFSRRAKIITGMAVGLLVAGGAAGIAAAVTQASHVQSHQLALDRIDKSHQRQLEAETHLPQAAYLYVTSWNDAEKSHFAQIKQIVGAPEKLISAKTLKPVKAASDELGKQFGKDSKVKPDKDTVKLSDQVDKELKDAKATFAVPEVAQEKAPKDITADTVKLSEKTASEVQGRAEATQAQVDTIEESIDQLDARVVADAKLLVKPATEGIKNKDSFVEPYNWATDAAKKDLTVKQKALQAALDAYNGKSAEDKESDKKADGSNKKEGPTPAERLDFKHSVEDYDPTLEDSHELTAALDAYVKSAWALTKSHDKTFAAEVAAQEAAAADQDGYADPTTGEWTPDYGNDGGGNGWTPDYGNGGGGGDTWTPPANNGGGDGGGWTPPADNGGGGTTPPADNGGGGGGGGTAPPVDPGWGGCPDGTVNTGYTGSGQPICGTPGW